MRHLLTAVLTLPALLLAAALAQTEEPQPAEPWVELFNGKDLTGWRANKLPESWTVMDGVLRGRAPQPASHLFYVGELKEEGGKQQLVRFKDFELEAVVRGEPNANSGIFFHADMTPRDAAGYLRNGYEVQLNSSPKEPRKTGSLYAVADLDRSPVDETQWFTVRIMVKGKNIRVAVDGKQVVDYTEPENLVRTDRPGRKLDPQGNAIALQAHDPGSVIYFRSIRIRRL